MHAKSRWNWLKWLLILTFTAGNGFCGNGVEEDIQRGVIALYNLDNFDVEVEMRTSNIEIEPGSYDSLSLKPLTRTEPRGLMSFEVTAWKYGRKFNSDQVRVRVVYYDEVLVTVDRIGRRDEIAPDKITLKRMEITSLTDRPLTSDDDLTGMWAVKSIKKGQILTSGLIEKIPPILNGQGVSIQYKSGLLEITARGTAMEDGYVGDEIRVRNGDSRKTIVCTVIDDETVQLPN